MKKIATSLAAAAAFTLLSAPAAAQCFDADNVELPRYPTEGAVIPPNGHGWIMTSPTSPRLIAEMFPADEQPGEAATLSADETGLVSVSIDELLPDTEYGMRLYSTDFDAEADRVRFSTSRYPDNFAPGEVDVGNYSVEPYEGPSNECEPLGRGVRIRLSQLRALDDHGVVGFQVWLVEGGQPTRLLSSMIGIDGREMSVFLPLSDEEVTLAVTAFDAAGNISQKLAFLTGTFSPEAAPRLDLIGEDDEIEVSRLPESFYGERLPSELVEAPGQVEVNVEVPGPTSAENPSEESPIDMGGCSATHSTSSGVGFGLVLALVVAGRIRRRR